MVSILRDLKARCQGLREDVFNSARSRPSDSNLPGPLLEKLRPISRSEGKPSGVETRNEPRHLDKETRPGRVDKIVMMRAQLSTSSLASLWIFQKGPVSAYQSGPL